MPLCQHAVRAGVMLFVLAGVSTASGQTRPAPPPAATEVPDSERIAKAPGPWEVDLMPKCVRCTFPEWPHLPAGESVRFRLHVVVVEDGTVRCCSPSTSAAPRRSPPASAPMAG